MFRIKNFIFIWKTVLIFEFYEQKYVEKVYLKIKFGSVHQTGKILKV